MPERNIVAGLVVVMWGILLIGYVATHFSNVSMMKHDVIITSVIWGIMLGVVELVIFVDWTNIDLKNGVAIAITVWLLINFLGYGWFAWYIKRFFSTKDKFIWVVAIIIGFAIIYSCAYAWSK